MTGPVVHPTAGREDVRLSELADSLFEEAAVIDSLREALLRQRGAVAESAADRVNASVDEVGRILLTLDEARRRRVARVTALFEDARDSAPGRPALALGERAPFSLGDLERILRHPVPQRLSEGRAALRRAAERTSRDAAINRGVLRRAVENGEAFLQALFSTATDPAPVYRRDVGRREIGLPGVLFNRTA